MFIVIGILISIIGILMIFFNVPGSKTKTTFNEATVDLIANVEHQKNIFTEEDVIFLPTPVQRYFKYCGYIGKPKMSYINIYYQDVEFLFGKNKSALQIDYTQYNFANEPNRIAYIDSSMYGIPFEGLDTYLNGYGSMKGELAKLFTLFDQKGKVMDQSSLVTYLSEILFIPSAALQDFVTWEAIDDLHAKATISYWGISVDGIFSFKENGEMVSFVTDDRGAVETNGSSEIVKWTVVCDKYIEVNNIKKPTVFKAIWNYSEGDLIYFDGNGTITSYN